MTIVIFDIDGTLADCTHRLAHIQGATKNWDAFYRESEILKDAPISATSQLLWALWPPRFDIYFITGRPARTMDTTRRWLRSQDLLPEPHHILCRDDGDHRPDYIVKRELVETIQPQSLIAFAVEDRSSVVRMYREMGICCLQCRDGDY